MLIDLYLFNALILDVMFVMILHFKERFFFILVNDTKYARGDLLDLSDA